MNIIPLVSAFIIVITLFITAQFQNVKPLFREAKAFTIKQNLMTELRRDMAYQNNNSSSTRKESSFNLQPFIERGYDNDLFKSLIHCLAKLYPSYETDVLEAVVRALVKEGKLDYGMRLPDAEQQHILLELMHHPKEGPPLFEVLHMTSNLNELFTINTLKKDLLYTFFDKGTADKLATIRKQRPKKPKNQTTQHKKKKDKLSEVLVDYNDQLASSINCADTNVHPTATHGFVDKKTGIRLSRYEPY